MKKSVSKILLIAVLLAAAGCSQYGATKKAVKEGGAEASDEALKVALWRICKAASIGSIERWIGSDKELAAARIRICKKGAQADVVDSE